VVDLRLRSLAVDKTDPQLHDTNTYRRQHHHTRHAELSMHRLTASHGVGLWAVLHASSPPDQQLIAVSGLGLG
jgi:hypothetical protein